MSIEAKRSDAWPHQLGPRCWPIFFRRYLLVSAGGHTLWEPLHLPLYTISQVALNLRVGLFLVSCILTPVGAPASQRPSPNVMNLISKGRSIARSMIGGIPETQEMLDFCAERGIVADIEMIRADEINGAYERMPRGRRQVSLRHRQCDAGGLIAMRPSFQRVFLVSGFPPNRLALRCESAKLRCSK